MSQKIQCRICGVYFNQITPAHCAKHAISLTEYRKNYGEISIAAIEKNVPVKLLKLEKAEIDCVSAQSDLRVFTQQARGDITTAAQILAQERFQSYIENAKKVAKVLNELTQDWRLTQNIDGTPVATKDLVAIGHLLHENMKISQESVLRLVGSIVSDNKSVIGKPFQDMGNSFSGEYDKVPEMTPYQREKMRNLFEQMVITESSVVNSGIVQEATHESQIKPLIVFEGGEEQSGNKQ